MTEPNDDLRLVRAYRDGDAAAAAELYERYYDDALLAAKAIAYRGQHSEEFASEAFTRVLETIRNGLGPTENFWAYLRQAVRSVALNHYRDQDRVVEVDDLAATQDARAFDQSALFETGDGEIVTAFRRLPERWQQVIFYRTVEGRSPADVANRFGMSENALRALSFRARGGLRREYLLEIARSSLVDGCSERGEQLVRLAQGSLRGGERRTIVNHVAGCAECGRAQAELDRLLTRMDSTHVAGVLASVAGAAILPGVVSSWGAVPTAAGALGSVGASGAFGVGAMAGAPVLAGLAALAMLSLGGAAATVAWEVAERPPASLSVTGAAGVCTVAVDVHAGGGARATLRAKPGESSERCTISCFIDGELLAADPLDAGRVLVLTRPGAYTVTIASGDETRSTSFRLS